MPMAQARTRTVGSTRVQVQPSRVLDGDASRVKCSGHQRPALRLTAGPQTKNPGRAFYTCPLPRDDPQKCRFFKWEDELCSSSGQDALLSPSRTHTTTQTPRVLGKSPAKGYDRIDRSLPLTRDKAGSPGEVGEEIDWGKVNADQLEQDALARTPTNSQRTGDPVSEASIRSLATTGAFNDRLREAASGEGQRKRKPDHDEGDSDVITPKRAAVAANSPANPFLSPGTPRSPPIHPAVSPALDNLESISAHIRRQDRLLSAAQQMKDGLRKTIGSLQERNQELMERNRELEMRVKELESGH